MAAIRPILPFVNSLHHRNRLARADLIIYDIARRIHQLKILRNRDLRDKTIDPGIGREIIQGEASGCGIYFFTGTKVYLFTIIIRTPCIPMIRIGA